MKKLGKYIFYTIAILLWLVLAAGALEGWSRWSWHRIETGNPFVLSRTQAKLWPILRIPENEFSVQLTDPAYRELHRGPGKSMTVLPQPAPEEELLWRMNTFFAEDDFGRQVFSNVYGLNILGIDINDTVRRYYATDAFRTGAALRESIPERDAGPVEDAARQLALSGAPHHFLASMDPEHLGPFGYCLLPAQTAVGDLAYWLVFPRREAWLPLGVDTIWELPFFTYQKHVERKDRISALGITEDFYINNHGFRDWDVAVPKPEGTFRVLCIGASTTEEGPVNDLTYPAILETMLNEHFQFNRIDVVNCGISGMNSLKHRMRIGDYLALEPDLIVIYNAVNDICHDLFPVWVDRATPLQQRLRESRFFCRYFGRTLLPGAEDIRTRIDDTMMENLALITRRAREEGVEVAVCSFAAPHPAALSRVERDYYEYYTVLEWTGRYSNYHSYRTVLSLYNDALRALCRTEDILYIPVEENMRDGAVIFGDICHLRNPGIEKKSGIIADTLIPVIEEALGL